MNLHDTLSSMNCMIDGHNLIAQIPGMSLVMPDDEERLVQLLNQYGEKQRGKIEVYFDGAPVGQAGERNYGRVRAHFVPQSQTADEAIRRRLSNLGKSARAWKVISSDRSIQSAAREMHASVQKAEDFARQLLEVLSGHPENTAGVAEPPLSPAEVDEWLAIFKSRKSNK